MRVILPDGSVKEVANGADGRTIANSIGASLGRAAIAVKVNDQLRDLSDPIQEDSRISIVTMSSEDGLTIMRHTIAAQVLARAIKNLYPQAKLAIGPTIQDGFYYDVEFKGAFSVEDLPRIESEMSRIAGEGQTIIKKIYSREDAIALFRDLGEDYKVEIIKDSKEGDSFQIYHQEGTNFSTYAEGHTYQL